jgi:hypothetical protein
MAPTHPIDKEMNYRRFYKELQGFFAAGDQGSTQRFFGEASDIMI